MVTQTTQRALSCCLQQHFLRHCSVNEAVQRQKARSGLEMQRRASRAHVSVLGLWEEKENTSLSPNTLTNPLQLGQKWSGGLGAASLRAPGHHDASVVHLALAHLRGGVMLTGELSGAAQ